MVSSLRQCLLCGILAALCLLSFYAVSSIDGLIHYEKDYYFKIMSTLLAFTYFAARRTEAWSINAVDIVLLLYAAYLFFNGAVKTGKLFDSANHLLLFVVYLIVSQILRKGDQGLLTKLAGFLAGISFLYSTHGLLQQFGLVALSASSPTISGFYTNSAPYAGILAATVPISFAFISIGTNVSRDRVLSALFWMSALAGTAAVILTRSRAAFLALIVAAAVVIAFEDKSFRALWSRHKIKLAGAFLGIILLLMLMYGLRSGSADGRLFIWRVAIQEMFPERPFTGGGESFFSDRFMNFQGNHLALLSHSARNQVGQNVANTPYAFNEPVRMLVDDGILGFALLFSAIVILVRRLNDGNKELRLIKSAYTSCLFGMMTFALFSYPFNDLAFRVLFAIVLAALAAQIPPLTHTTLLKWQSYFSMLIIGAFAYIAFPLIRARYEAFGIWRMSRHSQADLAAMREIAPLLKNEGLFAIDFAELLRRSGNVQTAVDELERAKATYSNPTLYLRLAIYYEEDLLNADKARYNYRTVSDMLPHKFYPKYRLMVLTSNAGRNSEAKSIAEEILTMPVKVQSRIVDEIKASARKCLEDSLYAPVKTSLEDV